MVTWNSRKLCKEFTTVIPLLVCYVSCYNLLPLLCKAFTVICLKQSRVSKVLIVESILSLQYTIHVSLSFMQNASYFHTSTFRRNYTPHCGCFVYYHKIVVSRYVALAFLNDFEMIPLYCIIIVITFFCFTCFAFVL
jgi:hypothetical protein